MLRFTTLCMLSSFLLVACGGNDAPTDSSQEPMLAASTAPSTGKSCLGDLEGSLCDWLPEELINSYFPAPGEMNGYKDTERKSLSSCGFSYEDPTQQVEIKVGSSTMDVPANYFVTIMKPGVYKGSGSSLKNFQSMHRTPTAEEMQVARAAAQQELEKQLAEGKIDQQVYDQAISMKSTFLGGSGPSYEAVENLGDAAVWGKVTQNGPATSGSLFVLHGDVTIKLEADAVESYERSRELAIAVAREIMKLCD